MRPSASACSTENSIPSAVAAKPPPSSFRASFLVTRPFNTADLTESPIAATPERYYPTCAKPEPLAVRFDPPITPDAAVAWILCHRTWRNRWSSFLLDLYYTEPPDPPLDACARVLERPLGGRIAPPRVTRGCIMSVHWDIVAYPRAEGLSRSLTEFQPLWTKPLSRRLRWSASSRDVRCFMRPLWCRIFSRSSFMALRSSFSRRSVDLLWALFLTSCSLYLWVS